MSLASLVTVPSTYFLSPCSSSTKSVSAFSRGPRLQARIGGVKKSSEGTLFNGGPVPLDSSFLGILGTGKYRRDGCTGTGNRESFLYGGLKRERRRNAALEARASSFQEVVTGLMETVQLAWTSSPPTWEAAFISVGSIFVMTAPVLLSGLTASGIFSAYLLGSLIWRAYGGQGLSTIVLFFVIGGNLHSLWGEHRDCKQGTAATKLKLKEKQKEGIAEKRSGRRGPASVWGSGTAAAICAFCSIYGIGGSEVVPLWQLGYLASLCTKLSDTISSEIGKAYGKTTYLVTTFSIVPRGTEGAVSLEGTFAGVIAASFLAAASYIFNQVDSTGAVIAVGASQLANLFESILGATLQGQAGYEWLTNDLVNVANITVGAALAMLAKQYLVRAW